uniref:Palm2 and akap2 fusion n=1 Tax=Oncorhynchus mykiss TaxID=8022 RepID=A0A8K9UGN8_ONCMY
MLCGSFVGKEAMVKQSKAMRERWLLQGTTPGTNDEDDGRRQQLEKDEEQGKRLEDSIDRLESEIGLLESEECQISAKEQTLRERLRKTERSIEDLQKVREPMYAMEINVEKDRKTGDTRILSASAVSPDEVPDCGVKVFDDGRNVVYEVRSGGSSTLDNGVHHWSSQQVDELMKRVGATTGCAQGGKAKVTVNHTDADDPKTSPRSIYHSADLPTNYTPYTTPPAVPSSATTAHKIPQPHAPSAPITTQPPSCREVIYGGEVTEAPQATAEKPITMIFMGNHNVDDQDETKRLLGFDGTIKAEIVLIDEDDEKSLREKTVTDGYSTMDGNAADLVSGSRPLSDTTELSSEGKDESSATATKELPSPAGIEKKERCHCCTIM